MILKIDAGYSQIQGDSTKMTENFPRLKVDLEISKDEMEFIRNKDKETFERLCHIIKMAGSECAKGIQIY